jgi:hypothetical protein
MSAGSKKHRSLILRKRHFSRYFDARTTNVRSVGWLPEDGDLRGEVKKTPKSDFQEKTFLEIFRCEDYGCEVCWMTVGELRGEVKKTSKPDFQEKTFLDVFRCADYECECDTPGLLARERRGNFTWTARNRVFGILHFYKYSNVLLLVL